MRSLMYFEDFCGNGSEISAGFSGEISDWQGRTQRQSSRLNLTQTQNRWKELAITEFSLAVKKGCPWPSSKR